MAATDPLVHTARWRVRHYECDPNGHVNNAVYLNWAEEVAIQHADAAGFGPAWTTAQGGAWVIHRQAITYHHPARHGDEVVLTVWVQLVRGVRGTRRTEVRRGHDDRLLAEVATEWVWVRLSDGRPSAVPAQVVDAARPATTATLAGRRRGDRRDRDGVRDRTTPG
ncbi:MAG TPA: acyl-CoA thioesterase [Candidatus Micrarchaeia archaeon]|nr:acyl-CoA thioesterase [Candidatus Micrarchaeia archaeon]